MVKSDLTDDKYLGNVLVRSDLNVPMINNEITDDFRISKSLEIIDKIYDISRTITFVSHLGRPNNNLEYSLKPIAERISDKLKNKKVQFLNSIQGDDINNSIQKLTSKIFVLENLRHDIGEKNNDIEFSKSVTKPFETYIFDAFGASHREHASVVSFGKFLKSYQGPLMTKEVLELDKLLHNDQLGYSVLLGGAKISDKLKLIDNLLPKVEYLMIGGGMCFTFLKAMNFEIGKSLVEESFISKAKELIDSKYGKKIILPTDFGVTESIESNIRYEIKSDKFSDKHIGIDIGPETISQFSKIISTSKKLFWNGPMGIFEIDEFSHGTKAITQTISKADGYTSVGGGDSVSAINKFSDLNKFNHVSTGGGASLEYLEGNNLPGVNIYKPLII